VNIPEAYTTLVERIQSGDAGGGVAEARRLVEAGHSLKDIFIDAVTPCLKDVGDRFSRLELFLPDMMRAAEVVKTIHTALEGELTGEGGLEQTGRVVIGTVYGDIHDLGKNIVASMLEVNGFEVHDLGVNVESFVFLERARAVNADIIAISSLMSTSLPYAADVIKLVRASEPDAARFKIMIGGGPVTADYAARIGADAYGEDAADAVRQAQALLGRG
jgi:methanogenic corrinoid protein MtbC1